ncbi:hypothetical protein C8F01DRAFT_752889 [Mycena amicta]|nr:hypothetical protein C8F01DRAFT_752889 [Mycena amicta]
MEDYAEAASPSLSAPRTSPALALTISCRPITAAQTISLRHSVLWPDKDVEYVLLPEDANGRHYGAFICESSASAPAAGHTHDQDHHPDPLAVISLFAEECPTPTPTPTPIDKDAMERVDDAPPGLENNEETRRSMAIRFRKFACEPAYQGRGIGTQLLQHAVAVARTELDGTLLWCDAREATRAWYERRGLTAFGDMFYKGSVKYMRMKMALTNNR